MTAKDYATIQRMLGQIEGAVFATSIEVSGIVIGAVEAIDSILDRAEETERCRKAEP